MIEIYEVVKKLIGEIDPIGETHTDDVRFGNLKIMTDLVDKLLTDIDSIGYNYKDNHQFSMKRASSFAQEFQDKMGIVE
jgi:hypothetical protein